MFRRSTDPAAPTWIDDGRQLGDEWDAAGVIARSSRLRAALSRGLALALWAALALALLLGVLNLSMGTTTAPEAAATPMLDPDPVAPPAGCAELLVAGWIAGNIADPSFPGGRPPEAERQATRTYTAAAIPGSTPDRWGYLIAADVRQRAGDEWEDLGVHYFAVTMVRSGAGCGGWNPVALPMQVPPPRFEEVSLPYTVTLPDSQTELSDTLEAFFDGMLTGAGNIDRFVAPGTAIPAINPPPYPAASLTGLQAWAGTSVDPGEMPPDGTTVRLLATVTVEPAGLPLVYPLTAAVRGGRWEVVAIAPLVGDPVTEAAPDAPDQTRVPNSP